MSKIIRLVSINPLAVRPCPRARMFVRRCAAADQATKTKSTTSSSAIPMAA
jgi:hypothetical protein